MLSHRPPSLMALNTLKNRNCIFQLDLRGLWAFRNANLPLTHIFTSNTPLTSRRGIFLFTKLLFYFYGTIP